MTKKELALLTILNKCGIIIIKIKAISRLKKKRKVELKGKLFLKMFLKM